MAYSFQNFTVGQVLTAAQMNQVEVNIRDHIHGTAGVLGGNYVVTLNTDLVSHGATTNSFCVVSFSVPANTIGSNSTIRTQVIFNCLSAGGSYIITPKFGSTFLSSFSMTTGVAAAPKIINYSIHGRGVTNAQICYGYSMYESSGTVGLFSPSEISSCAEDSTTALNFSIFIAGTAATSYLHRKYYMVERIYL